MVGLAQGRREATDPPPTQWQGSPARTSRCSRDRPAATTAAGASTTMVVRPGGHQTENMSRPAKTQTPRNRGRRGAVAASHATLVMTTRPPAVAPGRAPEQETPSSSKVRAPEQRRTTTRSAPGSALRGQPRGAGARRRRCPGSAAVHGGEPAAGTGPPSAAGNGSIGLWCAFARPRPGQRKRVQPPALSRPPGDRKRSSGRPSRSAPRSTARTSCPPAACRGPRPPWLQVARFVGAAGSSGRSRGPRPGSPDPSANPGHPGETGTSGAGPASTTSALSPGAGHPQAPHEGRFRPPRRRPSAPVRKDTSPSALPRRPRRAPPARVTSQAIPVSVYSSLRRHDEERKLLSPRPSDEYSGACR